MNILYLVIPIIAKEVVEKTIRKEFRDLTKEEWQKYKQAFNLFREKGYLKDISKLHQEVDAYAHRNGRFLPWHRMLLLHVESIMQMLTKDKTLGIPYWDWTIDANDPAKSKIFDEDHWGINKCYLVDFPTQHCLERIVHDIEPFYNKRNLDRLMNTKMDYEKFRDIMELVPHAIVHMNLGGDMGKMFSTNDPVFWHHHSFIDYLWYQKQIKHLKDTYGGTIHNNKLSREERLYPFNRQVKDVMSLKNCQVVYKPYKPYKPIFIQTKHKKPTPLSEAYINYHNYDVKNVRKYERFMRGEDGRNIIRRVFDFFLCRNQNI